MAGRSHWKRCAGQSMELEVKLLGIQARDRGRDVRHS
jgi:hypothetical protein